MRRFLLLSLAVCGPLVGCSTTRQAHLPGDLPPDREDAAGLRVVAKGVNSLRGPDHAMVVITHYQRLLDHIKPDVVHIMANGRIVKTGGPELALEVEQNGYADILAEVA